MRCLVGGCGSEVASLGRAPDSEVSAKQSADALAAALGRIAAPFVLWCGAGTTRQSEPNAATRPASTTFGGGEVTATASFDPAPLDFLLEMPGCAASRSEPRRARCKSDPRMVNMMRRPALFSFVSILLSSVLVACAQERSGPLPGDAVASDGGVTLSPPRLI